MASPVWTQFWVLLVLSFVMVIAGRHLEVKSSHSMMTGWKARVASEGMPPALQALSTPLSPTEINRYVSDIRSQKYSGDSIWAASFCSTAGLACYSFKQFSEMPDDLVRSFFSGSSLSSTSEGKSKSEADTNSDKYSWFTEKSLKFGSGTARAYRTPGYVLIGNGNGLQHRFLPRSIVNALGPLSLDNLPKLVQQFGIPEDSFLALGMHFTLERLASPPAMVPGEIVTNIASWEDFAEYLSTIVPHPAKPASTGGMPTARFGPNGIKSQLPTSASTEVLPTTRFEPNGIKSQFPTSASQVVIRPDLQLEVLSPRASFSSRDEIIANSQFQVVNLELKGDVHTRYATCESYTFPFQVQSCRSATQSRIYQVTLQSTTHKDQFIQTTAVCYTDTSKWSPKSQAFNVVASKPGLESICRWAVPNGFTVVPKLVSS